MRPEPCPSDPTDAQWAISSPLLPQDRPLGRPRETGLREIADAILYRNRSGGTWRALPHDSPPWRAVSNYLQQWRGDGTWGGVNDALRREVRREAGRGPTPSAGSIDSRTVKASEVGGPHGYDGGRKLHGRERHITADTLGLLLAVTVAGAAADDGTAAPRVLSKLTEESFPRLKKLWADNQYHNHGLNTWISEHGWYAIEDRSRPPGSEGFRPIKWRWAAERTFAWLGRCRVHSRDHEREAGSSEAQVRICMIGLMLRRLAPGESAAPFRYPRATYQSAA